MDFNPESQQAFHTLIEEVSRHILVLPIRVFWVLLCTFWVLVSFIGLKMCISGPKVSNGQHQIVSGKNMNRGPSSDNEKKKQDDTACNMEPFSVFDVFHQPSIITRDILSHFPFANYAP
jgi:hypothetical protein